MKDTLSLIPELFFDIIGIFIPGALLYLGLDFMGLEFGIRSLNGIASTVIIILIIYVTGHFLYAISTITIAKLANRVEYSRKEEWLDLGVKSDISPDSKQLLLQKISEKWKIPLENGIDKKAAYEFCRNYIHVRNNERASFIRKEQAYGELARSMPVVSIVWTMYLWISSPESMITNLLITSFFMLVFIFFFWRYLQARRIDAMFVYFGFLVLEEQETQSKQK